MSEERERQPSERIAEVLQDELGGDLRVVSYYSPEEEQVAYMRDDLREQYTFEEDREILREMLLESLGHGRYEELFGSELEATARIFEDQVVTVIPTAPQEGIIVSLERDGDYSYFNVLDECGCIVEQ